MHSCTAFSNASSKQQKASALLSVPGLGGVRAAALRHCRRNLETAERRPAPRLMRDGPGGAFLSRVPEPLSAAISL